jgi:hypothetical protein
MEMKEAFTNFQSILDEHTEDLATRKHGYIRRLDDEYRARFPDSRPLKTSTIYYFIKVYRLTHEEIEKKHGRNYEYNQAWVRRKLARELHMDEEDEDERANSV